MVNELYLGEMLGERGGGGPYILLRASGQARRRCRDARWGPHVSRGSVKRKPKGVETEKDSVRLACSGRNFKFPVADVSFTNIYLKQ